MEQHLELLHLGGENSKNYLCFMMTISICLLSFIITSTHIIKDKLTLFQNFIFSSMKMISFLPYFGFFLACIGLFFAEQNQKDHTRSNFHTLEEGTNIFVPCFLFFSSPLSILFRIAWSFSPACSTFMILKHIFFSLRYHPLMTSLKIVIKLSVKFTLYPPHFMIR